MEFYLPALSDLGEVMIKSCQDKFNGSKSKIDEIRKKSAKLLKKAAEMLQVGNNFMIPEKTLSEDEIFHAKSCCIAGVIDKNITIHWITPKEVNQSIYIQKAKKIVKTFSFSSDIPLIDKLLLGLYFIARSQCEDVYFVGMLVFFESIISEEEVAILFTNPFLNSNGVKALIKFLIDTF